MIPLNILCKIQQAVKYAVQHKINITPRSGGHSYESLSCQDGSLTFDISAVNKVNLISKNEDEKCAFLSVGAGARLGWVYSKANRLGNYAFNAGTCPSVGIGGHITGGGYGLLGRLYGLAADQTVGMKVVLASGEI